MPETSPPVPSQARHPARPAQPARPGLGLISGAWLVCTLASAAACGPATGGDPEFWTPAADQVGSSGQVDGGASAGGAGSTGGAGGAGGSGTTGDGGGGATTTTTTTPVEPQLTVEFKTVSFGGHYAPRNVGAVWIESADNQFVKTLELWAKKRSKYLVKWKAASASNVVDAITGATKSSHVAHSDHWNGTDVNGNVVPDGTYHLYIEFTEQDGAGKWTQIDFEKGATPVDLSPPDEAYFVQKHLTFSE